jgi:pimeloyl-ACP methyl ester carboxylesterase
MQSTLRKSIWGLWRLRRHGFVTLAAFVISGCTIAPRTESPIPTLSPTAGERNTRTLIVMLPGRGDRAKSFQTAGFFAVSNDSKFDVMSVDAHFAYYKERSLVSRLHEDVIVPARENGYEDIWLLGVSMGGMGALLYADQHPDIVKGLILLAPYLGNPGLPAEISAAGGLSEWSAEESQFMDHETAIWK